MVNSTKLREKTLDLRQFVLMRLLHWPMFFEAFNSNDRSNLSPQLWEIYRYQTLEGIRHKNLHQLQNSPQQ